MAVKMLRRRRACCDAGPELSLLMGSCALI